jgi:hypothetical protein
MTLMVSVLCTGSLTSGIAHQFLRCLLRLELYVSKSWLNDALSDSRRVSLHQSAFPKSDANLFEWIGTIEGPAGTVRVYSHRSSSAS